MIKKLLLFFIFLYQKLISPLKPKTCRFYPTCSSYAKEAITIHGSFKGILLSIKRISKCHPFNLGGYDPVPKKEEVK